MFDCGLQLTNYHLKQLNFQTSNDTEIEKPKIENPKSDQKFKNKIVSKLHRNINKLTKNNLKNDLIKIKTKSN